MNPGTAQEQRDVKPCPSGHLPSPPLALAPRVIAGFLWALLGSLFFLFWKLCIFPADNNIPDLHKLVGFTFFSLLESSV